MTIIYGQEFVQGIVMIADSRASKSSSPWADNTQKIFHLGGNLFISFCGDIEFAGSIIECLIRRIEQEKEFANPHIFFQKGPKFIKFVYDYLVSKNNRNSDLGFIIAGIDYCRPEKIMENGKITGYMNDLFDKKTFKIFSPNFISEEANFFKKPILALGSGAFLINKLEDNFKKLYNFGGIGELDSRGLIISGVIKDEAEKVGEKSVGGLFQIVVIDHKGFRFVPYKTRSINNKDLNFLDLEMNIKNGRWIQRNLLTGKEIQLLYPPEVIRTADDSAELFALMDNYKVI
jgi:hypothetical protein